MSSNSRASYIESWSYGKLSTVSMPSWTDRARRASWKRVTIDRKSSDRARVTPVLRPAPVFATPPPPEALGPAVASLKSAPAISADD